MFSESESDLYHHHFQMIDQADGLLLSDQLGVHIQAGLSPLPVGSHLSGMLRFWYSSGCNSFQWLESPLSRLEQNVKSGLFEMMIVCEDVGDAKLLSDENALTIDEAQFLIGSVSEEFESGFHERVNFEAFPIFGLLYGVYQLGVHNLKRTS